MWYGSFVLSQTRTEVIKVYYAHLRNNRYTVYRCGSSSLAYSQNGQDVLPFSAVGYLVTMTKSPGQFELAVVENPDLPSQGNFNFSLSHIIFQI